MAIKEFESEEEMEEDFEDIMERLQEESDRVEEDNRLAAAEPILYVDYSLRIECPKCDEELDLASDDYDNEGEMSKPIFNNKWDELKGEKIKCTECGYEFEIHDVERF